MAAKARQKADKRPYHHGDLRRALVDTGLALVREQGLEALTVAEVGRRVGVSSAAPYKHFADRTALLRAMAADAMRQLEAAIGEAASQATSAPEAFRLAGVAYVRWAAHNPVLYRLSTDPAYVDYAQPAPDRPLDSLETTLEPFWRDLAALVRSGAPLSASHPLIVQLHGRALAQGLAGFFVSGVFGAIGIDAGEAERLMRAVTGEDVPGRTGGAGQGG